jgi:multicomponent Na+:H+ antiporter subunit D
VLLGSSLLSVVYLLEIPVRAFFLPLPAHRANEVHGEAPWPCVIALTVTSLVTVGLFVHPEPLYRLTRLMVTP